MANLRKVHPGDAIRMRADTFNAFIDAAADFQRRQRSQEQHPQPSFRDHGLVLVRNDSGTDRDRFDVLAVTEPIVTPSNNEDEFKNRSALVGVEPVWPLHATRFVVLQEPLPIGGIGRALASGVTPVHLTVNDPSDRFADILDGDCATLQSGTSGAAHILWKETSGSGAVWAVVRLGVPPREGFWARITASTATGYGYPDSEDYWRWEYTFEEVLKGSAGYDGWSLRTNGTPGITGTAYNTIEVRDASADGLHGNGVNLDHLHPEDESFEFQVQPAPDGAIVWMRPVLIDPGDGSNPDVEYWFTYENGVDGGCGVEDSGGY